MATAAVQLPSDIPSWTTNAEQESSKPTFATGQEAIKHDVDTVLHFFKPNEDGSPPQPTYVGKPETYERPFETHNVTIKDVSGDEDKYTLDSHGFQYYKHVARETAFVDDDEITTNYYREVDELLKAATGATRTFVFDHTIRRQHDAHPAGAPQAGQETASDAKIKGPIRGPVRRVHIDQSYEAALSRVPYHLPEEAEKLLKGRVQLINVWRPIRTVKRDPLAVAQSQTVPEEDLVPVGLIYEKRKGATLSVKHNPNHQFFYKHHQTPEDVLLIKCFDNRAGVGSDPKYKDRAKRVPHTAFEVPGTEEEESRESIEVRCLVFHEDDLE